MQRREFITAEIVLHYMSDAMCALTLPRMVDTSDQLF